MRWIAALSCVLLAVLSTGCFETKESYGGETHFMRGCDDAPCGDGLACVCGVCTQACEGNATCAAMADGASCAGVAVDSTACGQADAPVPARACALTCVNDATCSVLGSGFVCVDGECREEARASEPPVFTAAPDVAMSDAGVEGPVEVDECTDPACQAVAAQPLVMLLVDTSGSVQREASCECTTPACEECLPDCAAGERSRWMDVVEALAGRMEDRGCERLERTAENGATYDLGYYLPHFAPTGTPGDDGVLDEYGDRVRFGLATFDGWDTYQGATPLVPETSFDMARSEGEEGSWSYSPVSVVNDLRFAEFATASSSFRYPGSDTDYYMDTGVQNANAPYGGLMAAIDPRRADAVNDRIQDDLMKVRPYGGTPIAAALDDLYYYFARDPAMAVERARPAEKHVVLITDGYPDADYRDVGCNCGFEDGDCGPDPTNVRYNPALMHCPYPTAVEAARALKCRDTGLCEGPVTRLYVVGYAVEDEIVIETLDTIARQTGVEDSARRAHSAEELRTELGAVMEMILEWQGLDPSSPAP